jgi:hypothetical protein
VFFFTLVSVKDAVGGAPVSVSIAEKLLEFDISCVLVKDPVARKMV